MTDTAVTTVIDNILTHLDTHLSEVDYKSRTEFFPVMQTTNTAVLAMPFGMTTTATFLALSGSWRLVHRIPFEFWIKHVNGAASTSTAAAFDLGYKAIRVLQDHDETDFSLDADTPLEWTVDPNPSTINNLPWLVATLVVPAVTYQEAA